MTNLEWLRELPAEQLANKLHEKPVCQFCTNYNYKTGCMYSIDDESHCVEGMTKWLKTEHLPKIKPCANCGGKAIFVADPMRINPELGYVQCCECHIRTPVGTKYDVINIWNRRIDDGKVDGD